ncbi:MULTISPECIES: hypothetical protein [Microbacterium]|uniref:hypothetical protein n=1 Tax=Microbacterium TaxID=33882 RepID=UPI0023669C6D|nr:MULTISPECIES: hypothetical protein [Microbacterium]WHE36282.1 hypothetical protein P6897_00735 [Microbacterium sp. BDGP8]
MTDRNAGGSNAGERTVARPSYRRWLAAAVFVGVIALIPASIISLTAPNQSGPLRFLAYSALWFVCGGVIGGTAIRVQQAVGWSRATAPLVSVVLVSVLCGATTLILQLFDPGGYLLHAVLVIAAFAMAAIACVTLIAAFIPVRLRPATAAASLLATAALLVLNILG